MTVATTQLADRAREAIEVVCSGDLGQLERYYDERFVDHVNDMTYHGHAGARKSVSLYLQLFPDLRFEVEEQVSEGERVASRFVLRGTYRGRRVALRGIVMSRFEGERIVEDWGVSDTLSLLRQLGILRSLALGLEVATGRVKLG